MAKNVDIKSIAENIFVPFKDVVRVSLFGGTSRAGQVS
jgi:hypothetical protein